MGNRFATEELERKLRRSEGIIMIIGLQNKLSLRVGGG